jgi:hypothetical protein
MSVNAGTITLDLVIKEQIDKQMSKIKSQIENALSKPTEQAAQTAASAVEKAADKMSKATSGVGKNAKKSAKEAVSAYTAEFEKMVGQTETVKQLMKQGIEDPVKKGCEAAGKSTEQLGEKLREVGEYEVPTDRIERLKKQLENTTEKISILHTRWQELQTSLGTASTEEEAAKLVSQLNSVEKQLINLTASAEKAQEKINQLVEKTIAEVEESGEEIADSAAESDESVEKATTKTESKLKKTFNVLKSVVSKALSVIKSKFSRLKGTINSLSSPLSKFGNSIKRAAKSALLMTAVYAAFRGLKSAVETACEGNDEFAKSLNEIKANLSIAFQPIMSAIMPAINTLMSGLAQAAKALATFTSELFGSTYEKSLETVKKVKEVGKEAQKNSTYLASFDEMNVAEDASSSDSSDDSSDSGVDYSAISGEGVELPDWAERMKEAIRAGDWEGVGKLLGERVNSAVEKINWGKIQTKVNKAAKNAAKALNGLVEGVNWKKLGNAVGEGINTVFGGMYTFLSTVDWNAIGESVADFLNGGIESTDWDLIGRTFAAKWNALIDTVYGFVTTFDWSGFGESVGESVNAWFDEIDFAKAGETLGETIKGILDTGIAFLQTVDWQGIGEKVWTFISSIDWSGIISRVFELIGSLIGSLVSLLWGFIKTAVYAVRDYFSEKFEECGGNVIDGLLKGIGDAVKSIGSWIKENIFNPFIDGFKKCFNIHSPSRVMDEQGGLIMDGLLGGITSKISTVIGKFKSILKKIKEVFKNIPTWFKEKFSAAWDKIKEVFDLSAVKKHFGAIKDKITEIFGGLKDALKEPLNWVIDLLNKCIDGLNTLSIDVPDWVPGFGGSSFGFNIPEIPRLATGGLATAPTLAMVGDNPQAQTDPEAILPVSKLQEMLDSGRLAEVAELLREILEALKSLDLTVFATVDKKVLFKAIQDMAKQYERKTGRSAF